MNHSAGDHGNAEEMEDMGMADSMMQRGARLRAWRAMMEAAEAEESCHNNEQDEPQQQQQQQDDDNDDDVVEHLADGRRILRYDSYLRHQRYYDDLKHVDCHFMDYGMIGPGQLIIEQDKSLGKGGLCWDAAFILGEHLLSEQSFSSTTQVLELGSGTGLCGLMVAKGCKCRMEITDLPELMGLMRRNLARNFNVDHELSEDGTATEEDEPDWRECKASCSSSVSARVLQWGHSKDYGKPVDVVLGADVVASLYDPVALAETMWCLCHSESTVYVSYKGRLTGPHVSFEKRLGELFASVERCKPVSRNRNPQVWILKATGRREKSSI